MSAYYDYLVQLAQRLSPVEQPAMLDYGCGAGEIVRRALDAGIDCYGVDVFYGGGSLKAAAETTGLLGQRILELEDGRIPMANEHFDIVVSNQVFEHIDDFSLPLSEIDRVLKPGGVFINVFPSMQVWREGHVGIPFSHRFAKGSIMPRLAYVRLLRSLGLGYHKGEKSVPQWSEDAVAWLDTWTFYKPRRELERLFARYFAVTRRDHDYIAYRIARHPRLAGLTGLTQNSAARLAMDVAASRLAGHVFVLRKPAAVERVAFDQNR